MHPSIRRHVIPALLVVGLGTATTARADAFKTFRAFGGAVHEAITREAIGSEVSRAVFRIIDEASASQDKPGTPAFEDPARHFVDGSLRPSIRHAEATWRKAKDYALSADRDPGMRDRSLQQLGFLFHTIQDFYSHANYIEMELKVGVQPDQIGPMPWESPNRPANLKTGYFYYDSIAQNELTIPRATAIRRLQAIYPATSFWSDYSYSLMRSDPASYEQAIAYASTDRDVLHFEVDKDNASSLQGKVIHPGSGLTLHEIARRVAVKDTRQFWHRFLYEVKRDAGTRGGAITAALTGWDGIVCPPTLAGYPLTKDGRYQGGIRPQKNGTLLAECRYGHGTDSVNDPTVQVGVLWAVERVPYTSCAKMREYMATLNVTQRDMIVRTSTSAVRWAAVSYSTKLPERESEVRALADEFLTQVEPRALRCPS